MNEQVTVPSTSHGHHVTGCVPTSDPIFALIAQSDVTERAWLDAEARYDVVRTDPNFEKYQAIIGPLYQAHSEALDGLTSCPPVTHAGLVAYCRWMARYFEGCLVDEYASRNLFQSPVLLG